MSCDVMENPETMYCNRCRKTKLSTCFLQPSGKYAKRCAECRQKQRDFEKKWNERPHAKQINQKKFAKYQASDKRKVSKARHKASERFKQTEAKYEPRKKQLRKLEYQRIHGDPGKHLEHAIVCKIGKMTKCIRKKSATVSSYTEFEDTDDLKGHLESLFEPWMTFQNFGKHRREGERKWNIGHRIARFHYDPSVEEDVRRCWMKTNLFPQDAKANISAKVKFPDQDELLSLRQCWPTNWKDELPSQLKLAEMERAVFANCGSWAR